MNNLDFDEVKVTDSVADFSKRISWFKRGKLIKELKINDCISSYPHCPACLKWRGELIEMSERVTFEYEGKFYTYNKCPKCKGYGGGNETCSCGSSPHRLSCECARWNLALVMWRARKVDRTMITNFKRKEKDNAE